MKILCYALFFVLFLLSGCASGQYSSSEDGIYFNSQQRDDYGTSAFSQTMVETQKLNEKTQTVITTRKDASVKKQEVDTLRVTNENRTVEIDAEPNKTYLIVDESDSYARRLRMFDEEEYTPPTININLHTGYLYDYYDWQWYSYWDVRWHSPWLRHYYYPYWAWPSWRWNTYYAWNTWLYHGYYYPHYYYSSYYYPYYYYYPVTHYYAGNHHRGRRHVDVRPTPSLNRSRQASSNHANRTATRPQIQQVRGNQPNSQSGGTGSNRADYRRRTTDQNISSNYQPGTGNSQNSTTGSDSRATRRRSSTSSTSAPTTPYTRNATSSTTGSSRRSVERKTTTNIQNTSRRESVKSNTNTYSQPSQSSSYRSSSNNSTSSGYSSGSSNSSRSSGSSGSSSRRR